MKSRTKWLRVALAAMAVGVMAVPTPATADPAVRTKQGIIYGEPGFCVHGSVQQAHTWHSISTFRTNCSNNQATQHAQYQQYYKAPRWGAPGTFCFDEGWFYSAPNVSSMGRHYPWDIWYSCNNGGGTWVVLTIDSWQYSHKPNVGWRGGEWRPATAHCHCP